MRPLCSLFEDKYAQTIEGYKRLQSKHNTGKERLLVSKLLLSTLGKYLFLITNETELHIKTLYCVQYTARHNVLILIAPK